VTIEKLISSYGSWKSPISSDLITSGAIRFDPQIAFDGEDIYWIESRPTEAGRAVIVRRSPDGKTTDITPPPYNARTRVHEYGGGAFIVNNGSIFFSNFADQRLYRQESDAEPQPITPEMHLRYADGIIDRDRRRIICVCEDHSDSTQEPVNSIVQISLDGTDNVRSLVSGNDFYSSPRLSPEATHLTWLTWNHPDMPWDSTELWIGDISSDGSVTRRNKITGGNGESICQPKFSPEGILYFISDRSGWWNLYQWKDDQIRSLWELEAEFAVPDWIFGFSNYGFVSNDRIICTYSRQGTSYIASLNSNTGEIREIDTPYTSILSLHAEGSRIVLLAGSPGEALSVVQLDLNTHKTEALRRSTSVTINSGYLSIPQEIEFPTEHGLKAYAVFYPPENKDYQGATGDHPPLLIFTHGGPTSETSSIFNLAIQYWTSRGFAVADVNYGGSSGYGREYRQRLNGQWGIVDVDDCVNCARYLVERNEVDADRIAIRGGSAGGYTTLAALTFRTLFKAGASYYGVSDLEALTRDTHKFESRYLDRLIGPYPERLDLYRQRSPIYHLERLSCPVIFFQGNEDKIVPPNQAEMMVNALREKGVPVAYLLFEGEQHGFRQSQNIKKALDAELYFYSRVFGFNLPDEIDPVPIDNMG